MIFTLDLQAYVPTLRFCDLHCSQIRNILQFCEGITDIGNSQQLSGDITEHGGDMEVDAEGIGLITPIASTLNKVNPG